jgi:hypothetical protein
MKKLIFIFTMSFLSLANLAVSQDDGPVPMVDEPDGNCLACQACTGQYIVCDSDEVDAIFDKMNNCGPGSTSRFLVLEGC